MSDNLAWTNKPPSLDDPDEAQVARDILDRETGVPRGHTDLKELKSIQREEKDATPNRLDSDKVFFIPCLAYCMMGLDRSVFDLYSWASDSTLDVVTYQAPRPLFNFDGVDVSENPWFYMIQGIDHDLATPFSDYIESYEFRSQAHGISWALDATLTRIADPFVKGEEREGVNVIILLPRCSDGRYVGLTPGGLHLKTPVARMLKVGGV